MHSFASLLEEERKRSCEFANREPVGETHALVWDPLDPAYFIWDPLQLAAGLYGTRNASAPMGPVPF
jgi:hypothetical protein